MSKSGVSYVPLPRRRELPQPKGTPKVSQAAEQKTISTDDTPASVENIVKRLKNIFGYLQEIYDPSCRDLSCRKRHRKALKNIIQVNFKDLLRKASEEDLKKADNLLNDQIIDLSKDKKYFEYTSITEKNQNSLTECQNAKKLLSIIIEVKASKKKIEKYLEKNLQKDVIEDSIIFTTLIISNERERYRNVNEEIFPEISAIFSDMEIDYKERLANKKEKADSLIKEKADSLIKKVLEIADSIKIIKNPELEEKDKEDLIDDIREKCEALFNNSTQGDLKCASSALKRDGYQSLLRKNGNKNGNFTGYIIANRLLDAAVEKKNEKEVQLEKEVDSVVRKAIVREAIVRQKCRIL